MITVDKFLNEHIGMTEETHGSKYWFCYGYIVSRLVWDRIDEASLKYFTKIFEELVSMQNIVLEEKNE